jgi:hypothetical protein
LLFFTDPSFSTTGRRVSIQELTNHSTHVVIGKVVSIQYLRSNTTGYALTEVQVIVQEKLAGDKIDRKIAIRYLGGLSRS